MSEPPAATRQRLCAGATLPRHRHAEAYVALVLGGAYEEAGGLGRVRVGAGLAVLHQPFDAHLNRVDRREGAVVLNLAAPAGLAASFCVGQVRDPDAVARAAERDAAFALDLLLQELRPTPPTASDWPDDLAAALNADPDLRLGDWARTRRLSPTAVSRGFASLYGETPIRYRLEARTRRAWGRITGGSEPLAAIAADCGFADQAHMSRAVKAMTGRSPGAWRAANGFKTAA